MLLFPQCFQKASSSRLWKTSDNIYWLNSYHTISAFHDPKKKALWKHGRKWRNQHFLLFPLCFLLIQKQNSVFELVVLGFNATLTAKVISWQSVTHVSWLSHTSTNTTFLAKVTNYVSHMLLQRWGAKIRYKETSPQLGIALTTTRSWVRHAHNWATQAWQFWGNLLFAAKALNLDKHKILFGEGLNSQNYFFQTTSVYIL